MTKGCCRGTNSYLKAQKLVFNIAQVDFDMKKIFPALLGGLSAGVAAWLARDLGLSHWAAAMSGAIGAFLGVAIAQAVS
jgi:hypothetical protein